MLNPYEEKLRWLMESEVTLHRNGAKDITGKIVKVDKHGVTISYKKKKTTV